MRYLSYRFDDGFLEGARKVDALLGPDKASFFIVSDLIYGKTVEHETLFRGRDFGGREQWRELARRGHEMQPHSVTHTHFDLLSPTEQRSEILQSADVVRELGTKTIVFGFPYNGFPRELDVTDLVDGAGFETRGSESGSLTCNDLSHTDLHRLKSWAPRERHLGRIEGELGSAPDNSWTILAFHSLDSEGHEPWTSEAFSQLISLVRLGTFAVVPVGQMVAGLQTSSKESLR